MSFISGVPFGDGKQDVLDVAFEKLEEVDYILKEFPMFFKKSKSVIAGGACRDMICGKPVRDIDIFVDRTLNFDCFPHQYKKLVTYLKSKGFLPKFDSSYSPSFKVYSKAKDSYCDYEIDLVFIPKTIEKHIAHNFNLKLSMCYFDKRGSIKVNKAFMEDFEGQILTFIPEVTKIEKIFFEYALKVRQKYPDHLLCLQYPTYEHYSDWSLFNKFKV